MSMYGTSGWMESSVVEAVTGAAQQSEQESNGVDHCR